MTDQDTSARLDCTPRLALVSAFGPELTLIRARMTDRQDHTRLNRTFSTGTIAGQDVVVFPSGVSMVNATLATQVAIQSFNLRGIAFSGVAGGADPAMGIGDIVVPERWGQYLEMAYARETPDGYALPPFLKTDFPSFGMMHTLNVGTFEELAGDGTSRFWFPVSADYLDCARRAASRFSFQAEDAQGRRLSRAATVHLGGNGVSGSAFVDNAAFRQWAHDAFSACVLDMETAAVAQVAEENGLPFIALRALSDLAGGEAGANEFDIFMHIVGGNLAALVEAFLAERP